MNPIETLLKVLGFAVETVGRVSEQRQERRERYRAPQRVPSTVPPPMPPTWTQPTAAGSAAELQRPHLWCVTANARGRGRSVEHCAYCNRPKAFNASDADPCPERRGI